MSQDSTPKANGQTDKTDGSQIPSAGDPHDSGLHYYSGGEIKELADTKISPALWGVWTFVFFAAVILGVASGAFGPNFPGYKHGGYKPDNGSKVSLAKYQSDLIGRTATGVQTANSLDLSRIPLPAGQNLDQAITAGSEVYQTYCLGCHGPNQDGNGVNAASLNPKPRNLHDAPFMQGMSYQRITTSIHKGVPGTAMPRWENSLTDDQIKDAIAYVWSLTTSLPSASPGSSKAAPSPAPNPNAAPAGVTTAVPSTTDKGTQFSAPTSQTPDAALSSPASNENTPVAPGIGAAAPASSGVTTTTGATH